MPSKKPDLVEREVIPIADYTIHSDPLLQVGFYVTNKQE